MGSQVFDASCNPLLAFAPETPIALPPDSGPVFTRTPTADDAPYVAASLDNRPSSSQRLRVALLATVSVGLGVLAGLAAVYPFTYRVIVPAVAPPPMLASYGTASTVAKAAHPTDTQRAKVFSPALSGTTPAATPRLRPASATTTAHSSAIEVLSRPAGAQVFLDGNVVGRAPLSIVDVAEGMHELRIELAGFHVWVTPVRVKGGSRVRIGASLDR